VQRFVLTENLDKVYAAVGKVFDSANVTGLKLEAFKYYYIPQQGPWPLGIVIKPTPELLKLEQQVIDAVTPFAVKTGTSAAFVTGPDPEILPALITYVFGVRAEAFGRELSSARHHRPRAAGIPRQDAQGPFEAFTFSPAGAAIYHLGHFGTAAKELKAWDLKP